jgi:DNA repair exonuclease SbcCD ATPase subunit
MSSEVETILNEIRERVLATEQARTGVAVTVQDDESRDPATAPTANGNSPQKKALARVSAHLITTARAWDRLPPVFSNRRGIAARLELWIKARFKSLTNWFTWEQVNFNAAVHHALSETLESLSAQEQQLRTLRAELRREAESRRVESDRTEHDLQALRASLAAESAAADTRTRQTNEVLEEITTRLSELAEMSKRLSEEATRVQTRLAAQVEENVRLSRQFADVEARISHQVVDIDARVSQLLADVDARLLQQVAEVNARRSEQAVEVEARFVAQAETVGEQLSIQATELNTHLSELAAEISSRLSRLANEISEVANDLHEEQRVCFKQLSLETSEASVREDRGRRAIETRLEELERRSERG